MLRRPKLKAKDILVGSCNDAFGINECAPKRVEAVGRDWIVARDCHGVVHTAVFTESVKKRERPVDALLSFKVSALDINSYVPADWKL